MKKDGNCLGKGSQHAEFIFFETASQKRPVSPGLTGGKDKERGVNKLPGFGEAVFSAGKAREGSLA